MIKQNIWALFFCAAGIGLNLLAGRFASLLSLPLYLDTLGSIVIAVLGGTLPGVIVGFATNIIKSISDPSSVYYGALNVLIAFSAARLAHRGFFKNLRGIAVATLIFTLIGGGLGALIPWYMDGLSFDSGSLSDVLYSTGFFNAAASHIIASLLTDLLDKSITVLWAVIIIRLIPERYLDLFCLKGWMQKPLSDEKAFAHKRQPVRAVSLQTKIILILGTALISISVVAGAISMIIFHKYVVSEHTRLAQGTARIAAGILDGDRIDDYLERGEAAPGYKETRAHLADILASSTDIAYLYVYRIDTQGSHVVFDLDTENFAAEARGTVIPFDDAFKPYISALLAGDEIDPVITNDKFGHLLTAYQPVFDSYGNCVCYVGADVNMAQLTAMERSSLAEMISLFVGFFILLLVLLIWLTEYMLIIPINSMTERVNRFSDTADTQESMDDHARKIRGLDIHTGDEVEKLYLSISRLVLQETEQLRNIRRLSDSTAQMQDGLIVTMADMVENRDSDTGAHIQKTAAYVRIIVEGLNKKGYYAEKITPKFISDVVRSAPLHDVGKINIPDEILNKPGKLTDEEYTIMKTHTLSGKIIMENAISTVSGENYLKEARNMAAYHHERWDGNGYPEKLHGEVIPLSARIMAVADVFDALTSPRIYKPAFPLEKALSIIEEGKGTQFDPKCVEVFMENLNEVKIVLARYNGGM